MTKYRKIFSLVIIIGLCTLFFSGCEKTGTELSELMIIQGIGIDYENGEYSVTVEILNNEQSGSPNGDTGSENKTKIYSVKGETVADALRLLTTKSGNLPLFAHNRVIILNEKFDKNDIAEILDFFVRNYDSRASQLICVAKGKAAGQIVRGELLNDTVKSEILENLLNESYEQALIPRVRITDAINAVLNTSQTLCIPAVTIVKNGENEDFELSGCVVYGGDDGTPAFLNMEESEGLAFLTNSVKKGFFTEVLPDGENVSFVINKSKTSYATEIKNGNLIFHLSVEISCDLDQEGIGEMNYSDEKIMSDLKNTVKKAVSKRIENTLNALQSDKAGDCIRFYRIFQLKNPRQFKAVEGDWNSVFKTITATVDTDVTIRRVGEEVLRLP